MSIFATDHKQLTLIYSGNTQLGKKALALVQASKLDVQTIDISKSNIGDSSWAEIAKRLNKDLSELVDLSESEAANDSNFSPDDALKILNKNDRSLMGPIAINGDKIALIKRDTEILEFFNVDSAGLKKTMHTDAPAIDKTTNGEKFV